MIYFNLVFIKNIKALKKNFYFYTVDGLKKKTDQTACKSKIDYSFFNSNHNSNFFTTIFSLTEI